MEPFLSIDLESEQAATSFGKRMRHPTKLQQLQAMEPVVRIVDDGRALIVFMGSETAGLLSRSLHVTEIEALALQLCRRLVTEIWNACRDAQACEHERQVERSRVLARRP